MFNYLTNQKFTEIKAGDYVLVYSDSGYFDVFRTEKDMQDYLDADVENWLKDNPDSDRDDFESAWQLHNHSDKSMDFIDLWSARENYMM